MLRLLHVERWAHLLHLSLLHRYFMARTPTLYKL